MLKRLMVMFGRTQKNKKKNSISADVVNGNIIQDSSIENNYITINDPAIAIRNIGKNSEELTKYFESVSASLASQHKLYPYYETGIQEINGKNFLYSRPLVPEAKTKYPSRIKGRFKIADEEVAGKYSLEEMARRAYISQKSVELEPVEVIKMLGEEIDPYQDGFLEEVKNTNFRLVPEKLPEAISCTLKVDGSDLEYDMMMKMQPVDPDKHILCMANENDSDGLKIIIVYSLVYRKISFTYRLNFNTWSDVRKFTLFQMTALKGSVIKIETKEEKEELFKATLQEPLSSESIEELKGDLELIKDVILVETEFGVSFSISDGFDNDDQEMLYFLANSIRRIPQEMQWTSYNAEARLTPATEADTKDLFKPEFSIRYTEIVNIKIQQMWIKNIKISNELKCCRFANPDQAYKDFIAAQQSEDKRINIDLVPADEERKALRIAVFE